MPEKKSNFSDTWKRMSAQQGEALSRIQVGTGKKESASTGMAEDVLLTSSSTPTVEKAPASKGPSQPWWQRKAARIALGVSAFVLVLFVVLGLAAWRVYAQVQAIRTDAEQAVAEGRLMYDAFKGQNLPETKTKLEAVRGRVEAAYAKYQRMGWLRFIPVARTYYQDGDHGMQAALAGIDAGEKILIAIEPHADLLGFQGEGTFAGTTEDRIGVVLVALGQISPALDDIGKDITRMQENLAEINPNDYPESVRGRPIRQYIVQAQGAAVAAETALNDARPALERLPAIAGADTRKKYLVIFQNDNELRPTGGFMTAYAVVNVEKGKVTPEKSDDIYELDKKFANKPPIPEQLGRFLITESKWNLRDMNIDPNFKNSMDTFSTYYKGIKGEPQNIDGIIAVDTVLLEKIVDVLGPIDVPGYGTFSSRVVERCDCPEIIYILSEIIDRPTPYHRENRKGILAPMMQAIIQKTYATSRDKWPLLAEAVWDGIEARHLQFYFFNEADQMAAESINAAGIIPKVPENGDYLAVVDANLAGAKSNLFVETSAAVKVTGIQNGRLVKEVELTYRNTHPPSNCNLEAGQLCLNGMLNDWTRWYVPKGTQLDSVLGLEEGYKLDTSNEGYDVIEGIFKLAPLGQTKVRITYSVPYSLEKQYKLSLQKQAGTDPISFEITTPWGSSETVLDKDRMVEIQ